MEKGYEERQKNSKEKDGFTCECEYCKSELEEIKNSEIKKECEKLKNVLKKNKGYFPYSSNIRNKRFYNKKQKKSSSF